MAIPGEKAIQMVRNAHTQAAQLDIAVTAAVVDQSGRMIALGRMDKARPITVEIALNKAYTAASFQQPTKDLAGVANQAWFQSLVVSSSGKVMPGGGAIPVVEGGNVVGAIAVSGGTDDQDQKCAEVALAAYQGMKDEGRRMNSESRITSNSHRSCFILHDLSGGRICPKQKS